MVSHPLSNRSLDASLLTDRTEWRYAAGGNRYGYEDNFYNNVNCFLLTSTNLHKQRKKLCRSSASRRWAIAVFSRPPFRSLKLTDPTLGYCHAHQEDRRSSTPEAQTILLTILQFDERKGPTWHCIVGRNFGSFVTHETKHFIYFYLGHCAILLFKTQ